MGLWSVPWVRVNVICSSPFFAPGIASTVMFSACQKPNDGQLRDRNTWYADASTPIVQDVSPDRNAPRRVWPFVMVASVDSPRVLCKTNSTANSLLEPPIRKRMDLLTSQFTRQAVIEKIPSANT